MGVAQIDIVTRSLASQGPSSSMILIDKAQVFPQKTEKSPDLGGGYVLRLSGPRQKYRSHALKSLDGWMRQTGCTKSQMKIKARAARNGSE
jgi:hypothetical protein